MLNKFFTPQVNNNGKTSLTKDELDKLIQEIEKLKNENPELKSYYDTVMRINYLSGCVNALEDFRDGDRFGNNENKAKINLEIYGYEKQMRWAECKLQDFNVNQINTGNENNPSIKQN